MTNWSRFWTREPLVASIALVVILMATLGLAFRPDSLIVNKPITEDGYYAFTVARNIALGNGITVDGRTRTNGFQPLFTILTVPCFWIAGANRILAIRLVLVIHWLVYLLTAYLMASIVCDYLHLDSHATIRCIPLLMVIWLSAARVFLMSFNGLETGFLLLMIALTWRYHQLTDQVQSHHSRHAVLGILLGFTVLARIDAVFLVIIVSVAELLNRSRAAPLTSRLVSSGLVSGIAFLVSLPWWLWNLTNFGSLMPSSGQAQMAWSLSFSRLIRAVDALTRVSIPWLYFSRFDGHYALLVLRLSLLVVFAAALFFIWKPLRAVISQAICSDTGGGEIHFFSMLSVYIAVLTVWYTCSSAASHFYERYFSPMALLSFVVFGLFVVAVSERWKPAAPVIVCSASLVMLLYCMLLYTGIGFPGNTMYSQQLGLVLGNVPPEETVAAGQSGTLGYFRDHVLNLDGKVNQEALYHQNAMHVYLDRENVRWLCDWHGYVERYLGTQPQEHGWVLVSTRGAFELYHRELTTR